MRLFIAVDLDANARKAVSAAIAELRQQCELASRDLAYALRWKTPDTLHLTIHFLGEVDVGRLPALRAALGQPVRLAPFELALGDLGIFGTGGLSRLVRLGVVSGAGNLAELHRELGSRLATLGFGLGGRVYVPHVTLARLKSPGVVDIEAMLSYRAIATVGRCRVEHATLYRSQNSPLGSTYAAVMRIPFAL